MSNGPHPISMLPDSAKLMHVTTNIVAADAKNPWFQLGLKIDLYKSDSPLPGLDVRILRIGTAGTIVNTMAYRGKDKKAHPFSQNIDSMFDSTKIDKWVDEKKIFDKFIFKIENYHPDHSDARAHIVNPIDWMVSDFSPKTKNKENMLSTSTSIGFDVGAFGSTGTGGLNYSQSQSREWSIDDYELLGSASVDMSHPSSVTWNVHRSSQDSDPDIAKSTFSPDFECVFRSSQSSTKKRYSVISAIVIPVFSKEVKVDIKIESRSIISKSIIALHNIFSGKKIGNTDFEAKNTEYSAHAFSVTLLVDWVTGRVETVLPPDSNGRVKLSSVDWSDGAAVSSENVKAVMGNLMPAIAGGVEAPELVYPEFKGDDPVGRVVPKAGVTSIEVAIPQDLLFYYYGGVSVSQGMSFKNSTLQALWGPFSNTLLIRGITSADPILISPKGYLPGDDDSPDVAKEPQKPGSPSEHATEHPKGDSGTPAAAKGIQWVSTHDEEVAFGGPETLKDIEMVPSGTGFEIDEQFGFRTIFCFEGSKYPYDLSLHRGESLQVQQVNASRFAWIGLGEDGGGLGLFENSLSLSADCFSGKGRTKVLPEYQEVHLDNDGVKISEMLKKIGNSREAGSVIISYPKEPGILRNPNRSDIMGLMERDIYFSITGLHGMVFVPAISLFAGSKLDPNLISQARFSWVPWDADKTSPTLPPAIMDTLKACKKLRSGGVSTILGSCISRGPSDQDGLFIHHFGM